ncbi:MAG: branched-chain amino acid ABC transporter permease [Lachnospiraceae bacterium]|nr:branched-chain amino acid ABC transporter permease [Lachnospiraceae bacterium]
MVITSDTIIVTASLVTAMITIGGIALAIVRWVFRQQEQDKDIKNMKEEQCLLTYGVRACLDGLEQMGANHTVTEAKNKIDEHLNQKAHDM